MARFKDTEKQYSEIKRYKGIKVGFYDKGWILINGQQSIYTDLPGWAVKDAEHPKYDKLNGFWFSFYVTNKSTGKTRNVGISLTRSLLINLLDEIDNA